MDLIIERAQATITPDMKIRVEFWEADKPTENGRQYSEELAKRETANFQKRIDETGGVLGFADHDGANKVNDACVRWDKAYMNGTKAVVEGVLLQTAAGNTIRALLQSGVKIGASTRGTGSVEGGKVADNYALESIDIVLTPAVPTAEVQVIEKKETQRAECAQQPVVEFTDRQLAMAGVFLTESGQVFNPEGGHGVVSDSSYEISNEPHKVASKAEAEPSFQERLAAAILKKTGRTASPTLPISDTSWVVLDGLDNYAVEFTRNADGSITVVGELKPLDQYTSQAVSTFRTALASRVAALNSATESRRIQAALTERRMLQLAGIPIDEDVDDKGEPELTEAENRMQVLAGIRG